RKYFMIFNKWLILQESSIKDLYSNTINAFPNANKRQNSIDIVKITELQLTPFLGMKTLFVKGNAQSDSGKNYSPIILFKNVNYHLENDYKYVNLKASDGKIYFFEHLKNNNVLARCDCNDFKWRFKHYNYIDESLFGKDGKKYVGKGLWEANPLGLSGVCKHLIKLTKAINSAGIIIN
ncbi:MAG: hypothetical protein WCG45_04465, partial [bacterium]